MWDSSRTMAHRILVCRDEANAAVPSCVAGIGMPRRWICATRTIRGKSVAQQQQQQQHHRVVKNKTRTFLLLSLLLILLLLQFRFPNFSSLRIEDVFYPAEEQEVEVNQSEKVVIFYNLFIGKETDIPRIRKLVHDQFRYWKATRHDGIHVTSIGVNVTSLLSEGKGTLFPRTLPVHRVTHEPTGWEMLTLDALWAYCQDQPSATVAYLHSKGSFHPLPQNEVMRQLLSQAALSRDCFDRVTTATTTTANDQNSTTTTTTADDGKHNNNSTKSSSSLCNTCSFRMSPYPHLHTSGNMWLAQCQYVRQLLRPSVFAERMELYRPWTTIDKTMRESCVGVGYIRIRTICRAISTKPTRMGGATKVYPTCGRLNHSVGERGPSGIGTRRRRPGSIKPSTKKRTFVSPCTIISVECWTSFKTCTG
jgi:hypothetical protein